MGEWFEPLEFYFLNRWRAPKGEPAGIPNSVYETVKVNLGGEKFQVDLVHPVDYDDERIAFLMIANDETFLFDHSPPNKTTVMFLGSLAGGRYTETLTVTDEGKHGEGVFSHPRLEDGGPLRVKFGPPPTNPEAFRRPRAREAFARTETLREKFRQWSREPRPGQPGPAA
jgi:hypothetical protein